MYLNIAALESRLPVMRAGSTGQCNTQAMKPVSFQKECFPMLGDTCVPTATEKANLAPCLGVPQFLRMIGHVLGKTEAINDL